MRTKLLLIVTFLSIVIASCNSDDNDNTTSNDPLHGEWNMKIASSGWISQDNIETGTVKFIFNTNSSILTVENNDESLHFIPDSGMYPYTIAEFEGDNYIVFEDEGWNIEYNGEHYGYLISFIETDQFQGLGVDSNQYNYDPGISSDGWFWYLER